MQIGVNVPNFGPGADPGMLRRWAQTVEGLGFDLLMVSDHIAVTPDVAAQSPAPFYEPFTTLAWLLRQDGMIVIPKASLKDHVRENLGALDLKLTDTDLADLDRAFPPPKGRTALGML